MSTGPNPLSAAWHMLHARRLSEPHPDGAYVADHARLGRVLDQLKAEGIGSLVEASPDLDAYRDELSAIDPDAMTAAESLALWINLYNAGALRTAARALSRDADSVLRVPGAFSAPWVTIGNETMSLDDIEHGKIRRFGDPRIHGALVCGSVSCPTLRREPFTGADLDAQLDDQMRSFLARGGAGYDQATNTLRLSRILKWYGADFVRPDRMPTIRPARSGAVAAAISRWLNPTEAALVSKSRPVVEFATYDWGLGCSVV